MHLTSLNRWQAFGVHLAISAAIFLILLSIIVFAWYPGVFIHMGGWQGIQIVAAVDLVLGPLLTLIVFNPTKKSLKMDLSIIAAIQIGCLAYGVWVVEKQRPMAQVLLDDTLYVIAKSDYVEQKIDLQILNDIPGPNPKIIMLDLPNDHTAIAVKLVKDMFTGNPLQLQTELYLPIAEADSTPAYKEKLDWWLDRLQKDTERDCYWLPVDSPHLEGEVCFSPQSGAMAKRAELLGEPAPNTLE